MGLDTGSIFKRPVLCAHCNEHYLFTLRAIAASSELKCPCCGNTIYIGNSNYEALLRDVRHTLHEIDCASFAPAFWPPLVSSAPHRAARLRLHNQPPPHVARYVAFSSSLIPVTATPIRA